jgi:hypothetical protein
VIADVRDFKGCVRAELLLQRDIPLIHLRQLDTFLAELRVEVVAEGNDAVGRNGRRRWTHRGKLQRRRVLTGSIVGGDVFVRNDRQVVRQDSAEERAEVTYSPRRGAMLV